VPLEADELPIKVAEPTAEWHLPDREGIPPTESPWLRALAWLFLGTAFAFFLFVRRTTNTEVAYTIATSQALFVLATCQGVLAYLYRRKSNHIENGTGVRRLQSKVPPEADLPVRVEIVRDGSMTGKDLGFIWLNDGTWYFKGLQTAFRFNQQDVVPVEAWHRSIAPDPGKDRPPHILPMKSRNGQLVLRVEVVNPYEDYAKRKRVKGFYREMYDWLTERPRGCIESLLPPTHVHPDLVRRGIAKYEGLAAAAAMLLVDSAVLAGLPREGTATNLGNYGLLAAIFVTGLVFLTVRFAWHELRDVTVRARLSAPDPRP
jgi:hypothetical protein